MRQYRFVHEWPDIRTFPSAIAPHLPPDLERTMCLPQRLAGAEAPTHHPRDPPPFTDAVDPD